MVYFCNMRFWIIWVVGEEGDAGAQRRAEGGIGSNPAFCTGICLLTPAALGAHFGKERDPDSMFQAVLSASSTRITGSRNTQGAC